MGITLFIILWLVLAIITLSILCLKGKEALSRFPDINSVRVVYRDKWASGYSNLSWKTKMGGSRNALDIVVTDRELWLKCMLIFAYPAKIHDMIHKVSLSAITMAEKKDDKIILDFRTEKDERRQLVLITKSPDEFLKAIKK